MVADPNIAELSRRVEAAIQHEDPTLVTARVKDALEQMAAAGELTIPERLKRTRTDSYARRLLLRHPCYGFTVVVMAWAPGQGTAIHDHAGMWCVEAVLEGRMVVTQYEWTETSGTAYRFVERGCLEARAGRAGCLIPPLEHHTLANPDAGTRAVSLHVYGGEMNRCHAFEPLGRGWYSRHERALGYDE